MAGSLLPPHLPKVEKLDLSRMRYWERPRCRALVIRYRRQVQLTCDRRQAWRIDGVEYCTFHGGEILLERMAVEDSQTGINPWRTPMTRVHNDGKKPNVALQVVDTETGQCTYKTSNGETQIFNIVNADNSAALAKWLSGEDDRLIQDAVPGLSANDRELCLSGLDNYEWGELTDEKHAEIRDGAAHGEEQPVDEDDDAETDEEEAPEADVDNVK